ncbi:MAG: hypothetical protein HDR00_14560 [Lachnospiraceae bacterium]|nr:hypothetical protein [Lachnospiraceae bacterium]
MQTYTGETPKNKQGGENAVETNQGEDLFLSGGYDSAKGVPEPVNTGMGQMNVGMGQLGSVGYGSGNAYGTVDHSAMSTNRWSEPRIILNLWGQLFNSFMPLRYDRYKGMSMNAAKDFVKFFVKLNLVVGCLVTAVMMLTAPGAIDYLKTGDIGILLIIIRFGVFYAIGSFIGPYFFRLWALIYRMIFGNLLMAIERKKVNAVNMYLISIYSCIPCMALGIPLGIIALLLLNIPSAVFYVSYFANVYAILELIVPIIIMAIAIPRME